MVRQSGQAIVEVLISSTLVLILFAGAGWVLRAAWDKGRCAALVFEVTRGALAREHRRTSMEIAISESDIAMVGEGRCGDRRPAIERVGFRKLEHLREWP
jgi:hypothetical protein